MTTTKLIKEYREELKAIVKQKDLPYRHFILRSVATKRTILKFFERTGEFPSRKSPNRVERKLGQCFENYVSLASASHDPKMRELALLSGRKPNGKRPHDIQGSKEEILSFIETHGRIPQRYVRESIEGEGNLHAKLDYYTNKKGDMSFLSEVYKRDVCHKSGIPFRFRPLINQALDVEKPLIRLPQYVLKGEDNE